jgi:hypothetical protein
MKILCPEHNGFINVPGNAVINALNSPLKMLVITCPVCEEEVLIADLQLDDAVANA